MILFLTFCSVYDVINDQGTGYFVEAKLTYVDLVVFHIMNAIVEYFPEAWAAAPIPMLKAFRDRITAVENVAAYLKSDRVKPWEGNSLN